MKKMSNKKKNILETALGLWTGICFGGWLCNAIECKDTEAMAFAVAWIVGPAAILFFTALLQGCLRLKKVRLAIQMEVFV